MLFKENRLQKKRDFDRIFKKGKGLKGSFFFLRFLKNDLKDSRFGVVVLKKISKKATTRNKIKRKTTESIKLKLNKIEKGFDCVLILKNNIELEDFQEISEDVEATFRRAGLIKN